MIREPLNKPAIKKFLWWTGLCVCCMPGCSGSGANARSSDIVAGGTFGSGGIPALGGTLASSSSETRNVIGGGSNIGGTNSGLGSGGASVSTGGAVAQAGGGVGGAATGTRSTNSLGVGGVATGGTNTGGAATGGSKVTASTSAGGVAIGGSRATGGVNTSGASTGASIATGGTNTGGTTPNTTKATGGVSAGGTGVTGGSTASKQCPSGITQTITVAKDGSGQYKTVQAAVDSIASGNTAHIRINIKAGTYTEKLTIASRSNLCLVGDSATTTILSYNDSNSSVGSTSGSASVYISANDFSATQLTFQNTFGAGSQAVALRTTGQRQQFLDCRFVGYQDTLYVHSGTQYFRDCYVQGNTDYVFGGATAILQNCEVRNVQSGSAVAAPNTASSTAYGIVFLGGQFTAASGVSNVALARPWGADGAAAFLNPNLGSHISAAGFTSMSGNDPANARFGEYQSTGAGANAAGRSSYQMSAAQAANYTIATVYDGGWTPSYSQ